MDNQQLIKQVKQKSRLANVLITAAVLFDLIPQVLTVHLIGHVFAGALSARILILDGSLMLGSFALKALANYGATWTAHRAAYHSLTSLRLQIVRHLKKLSLGFFQERKSGDLTNIIQHDVEQVEVYLAHGLPEIMSATVLPAVIWIIMLFLDWRLALVMIVGLPLMWLTRKLSAPLWQKNFKIFADSTKKMQEDLMEYIRNIPVIKAFGKDEQKTEQTLQSTRDYVYWVKQSMNGISIPMGFIDLFMESGVVAVMMLGSWLLVRQEISLSRFILSTILGALFTSSVAKTATFQHYRIMFRQAMKGIGSILNHPLPAVRAAAAAARTLPDYDLEIEDLDFAYPGKADTLQDIRISFKTGSKNALVGSSGCGKSTLANLLMNFWEPDRGRITVGGCDIRDLPEQQLISLFAIVQQEVFLFNLSLEENIRIGKPDASAAEVIEAAKKARIHDLIMALPQQYQTLAGEAGVKFSGGEKQRIAIARMILKDAPIVILDEATAAVDTENEAHIQAAIDQLSRDKTVIMIAHHLSSVQEADQIAVMERGRILDRGTHDELMAHCRLYQRMVADQNKVDHWIIKEELPLCCIKSSIH